MNFKTMNRFFLAMILTWSVSACDKVTDSEEQSMTQIEMVNAFKEYAVVSAVYDNENDNSEGYVSMGQSGELFAKSATINTPSFSIEPVDLTTFPKTITIDYGTEGMECIDMVTRKGKVTVEISSWQTSEGSISTTTFIDFYRNDCQLEGTITNTAILENSDGSFVYRCEISNGVYTTDDNDVIEFTRETERSKVEGSSTPFNITDDVFQVEGSETCTTSDGVEMTMTTTTPLLYSIMDGCTDGEIEFNFSNSTQSFSYNFTTKSIGIGIISIPVSL